MNQYLLSICYPAGATPPSPEALARIAKDVAAVNEDMRAAGAWVFAAALDGPASAAVVRAHGRSDDVLVTDGPFVETKEIVGGFCVIAAPDIDAALEWAAKVSRATTTPVEVRPIRA